MDLLETTGIVERRGWVPVGDVLTALDVWDAYEMRPDLNGR